MSTFNANFYYTDSDLAIIYTESLRDGSFLKSLNQNCFVFLQFTWNVEKILDQFPWPDVRDKGRFGDGFDPRRNLIFCAPNETVHKKILSSGYTSVLVNHNCFLDERVFSITDTPREYDAVINSRPFWWKRVYLADGIPNLAYIKGSDWAQDEMSWDGWKQMDFSLVAEKLDQREVAEIYNRSKIGLILSGHTGRHSQGLFEGANYSTGEYLLSGLPVVSTESQGGRAFWFNSSNSIICRPERDQVHIAVQTMLERIDRGEIERSRIRMDFLSLANDMKRNFVRKTAEIFGEHDILIDPDRWFTSTFGHKMCNYNISETEATQIIKSLTA